MSKVGILTWHYYSNFGSALQAYALQVAIRRLGHDVRIVNYRNPKYGIPHRWKNYIKLFIGCMCERLGVNVPEYVDRFLLFRSRYFRQTRLFLSVTECGCALSKYDAVVYGSDQIWAPNVFNPIYMGDYIPNTLRPKRLISYAASVGLNAIPEDKREQYTLLLAGFDAVSVREGEGRELLKAECGTESSVVLDPTMLLPSSDYRAISRAVQGISIPYVFCYFLNKDHDYAGAIQAYAREKGLNIYGISAKDADAEWMELLHNIGPAEFIYLIDNAQIVITDSYHGTIFSLLLHKDFRTIERFSVQDPISQNSRIRQLCSYFDIDHLVCRAGDAIVDCAYDYELYESRLQNLRNKSKEYLKTALQEC